MTARKAIPEEPESGVDIMAFVGNKGARRRSGGTIGDAAWERARREVREMIGSGQWGEALPRHFAAAYELLHTQVYKVPPAELDPKGRARLAAAASRALGKDHGGDRAELAEYMRWVWRREAAREQWRRVKGQGGGRIGPWFMFSGALLTDWRLAVARDQKAG